MKKILLFILLAFSFTFIGCDKQDTKDYGLKAVSGADELRNLLKGSRSYDDRYFLESDGEVYSTGAVVGNVVDLDYNSSDYTKTNIQVEGVDEGDIIKTDGSRIYSISNDRLLVVNLLGNGQMEVLLNEQIKAPKEDVYRTHTYYSELYVTDDYLIVLGQKYNYSIVYYNTDNLDENSEPKTKYQYYFYNYTAMSVVEIYDINSLEKVDSYEVSGYLLGSRLIDDNLYIMSNHYAYNYYEEDGYDVRPWYKHNGKVTIIPYEDIKYIPDTLHQSFTVISNIKLDKLTTLDSNVFLSPNSWSLIYVSTTGIYFASNYSYRNIEGKYEQTGLLISYQFSNKNNVFYGGYGLYKGLVLNQFAIDEYEGFVRLATTEGWGSNVINRLYIYKRTLNDETYKLETISLLDKGLGKPGERIQSVRFNKEIATIVTFLQTDPFYTIDLSDPYNPEIAGELEIPGFSTYQHPWSENTVLGIGFDTDNSGRTTGMKLALYDISDFENPKEVGLPFIIDYNSGWAYSEATYNHKALMIDKTRNSFGLALSRYDIKNGNDYIIFKIDETKEQPIQIQYSISHANYANPNTQSSYYTFRDYYINRDYYIKRALRVDDYLYVISNEVITSHYLLGDSTAVNEIILNNYFQAK